jgi:hypothetical protein
VSSLSTDAAGRLFCGTGTSALVALDAATGQVLYERVFDLNRCWPTYAVDAGGTLVVGSLAGVVAGLSPSTGETLWQKEWMPISGMPAVIGSRVFLATTDVRVRALDAASGNLLWERTYQPEEAVLPRWPLLTAQPVVIGDDRLLICAAKLELLDARDGRLLQSASQEEAPLFGPVVLPGPGDVPVFGPAVLLGRGFVVGWNRNDQAVVATLPDLKVRRLLLPRVRSQARGALQGRTLYVPGEEEVQAVDLDTGAVFAWFGDSDTAGDWITFGRWVYVISIDGRVRALPFPPAPPASSVSGATGDTPRGSQ